MSKAKQEIRQEYCTERNLRFWNEHSIIEYNDWLENKIKKDTIHCSSCYTPITEKQIWKGLYMKTTGGNLIHWNCDDAL